MTPESKLVTIRKLIIEKTSSLTPEQKHKIVELMAKQDILYKEMLELLKQMEEQNNDMINSLQNKKDISEEEQILLQRLLATDEESNPAIIVYSSTFSKLNTVKKMIDETQDEIISVFNA